MLCCKNDISRKTKIGIKGGNLQKNRGLCIKEPTDRQMEGAVHPEIASNGVSFLQMRFVGSYSTSGREKEG